MAMDKINGSPLIRPGMADSLQVGNKPSEETYSKKDATGAERTPSAGGDKAEISDTAHKLMDLRAAVDTGRAALEELPEIREDKVAQAKERLAQGYYDSPVVQEKLSAALQGVIQKLDEI